MRLLAGTAALLLAATPALGQTGTIRGTVSLEGTAPTPRTLTVTKNQDFCGPTVKANDLIVAGGKVAFAVIAVDGLTGPTKRRSHLVSNSKCVFEPPQLAAATGDTLVVDNQDNILHNTHLALHLGTRLRTMGNWGLSDKGFTITSDGALRVAGDIDVGCDAHPWMTARIIVFGHPYFAASDRAGTFEIRDVPAGTHVVRVRHPVLGDLEQTVTVKAGATTTASFAYPAARASGAGPAAS